jgi:RNA polymerase sigma-70 factor, ECF subfamily
MQAINECSPEEGKNLTDRFGTLTDEDAVRRVLSGDTASYELIMRRYNQRMFRVARSIIGDDSEAEDVVQETYVLAYEHLAQFAGRAKFSTWLTRIAVHEAIARQRRRKSMPTVDLTDPSNVDLEPLMESQQPEEHACSRELEAVLTRAIDHLPSDLRTVFTMRMVEELDTEETAACLDITAANVKVRLHRARALLRQQIDDQIGTSVRKTYQFDGERCDRIVKTVMQRLFPAI